MQQFYPCDKIFRKWTVDKDFLELLWKLFVCRKLFRQKFMQNLCFFMECYRIISLRYEVTELKILQKCFQIDFIKSGKIQTSQLLGHFSQFTKV